MIIHSIIPDEIIYAGIEDIQAPLEMWVNNILMQVEMISNHKVKVIRIVSAELDSYLNESYTPGQIIQLTTLV